MFIRKNKNRPGSFSVQIISYRSGRYKFLKTIGSGKTEQEVQKLICLPRQELERLSKQPKLFISETDSIVEHAFSAMDNASIRTIGQELIFEKCGKQVNLGEKSGRLTTLFL